MRVRRLRVVFVAIACLVLLVIAGMSGVLYEMEVRHSRAIDTQSHALQAIGNINAAQVVVHQQRVLVANSDTEPLNRRLLLAKSYEFQRLMAQPDVATHPDQATVRQILADYDAFVQTAAALPEHPTPEQMTKVDVLARLVTNALDDLRTEHHTDLSAIVHTEREQRDLTVLLLLTANGVILVLVGTGFLFLDRLSREQERRRVLEATDQLRNELVAFAAHELRNPATMISSGTYLLRQPNLDPGLREKALDSMTQSSAALGRLVMNLLNMGRIEEGRLHLHREPMPLPVLVGGLVDELVTYREGAGDRLQLDLPDVTVDVDADYARLAIANVLDNAMKYSPPDASIGITGAARDGFVQVGIHDRGPGIPPERLEHVFDKYETTEVSPQRGHRGTGLGLYMARLLVQAHGGRMWAESTEGEGTTIFFTLPQATPTEEKRNPIPARTRRAA